MKRANDGSWQARVPLNKGTHRYRFVVDGQWQQDPYNNATEPNPYGGVNSVINVR
jgi:1,4-alpha-glucan branching enzyme